MTARDGFLAVIPARGGSKGLPGKNIMDMAGKPLIAWTIEAARASRRLDRIVVSTDDDSIARVAAQWGAEVIHRPAELATDEVPIEPTLIHALDSLTPAYRHVVLLQPTSPLRTGADIDATIEECLKSDAPCCIAACDPGKSPYWMFRLKDGNRIDSLFDVTTVARRRQELPAVYAVNGACYVARSEWLRRTGRFLTDETVVHVMPRERSVDVDTQLDLVVAEACARHLGLA